MREIESGDESPTIGTVLMLLCFSLALMLYIQYPSLIDDNKLQDDGRQHLFWMARFYDTELFQDDFITQWQTREIRFADRHFIFDYKNIGFSIIYYCASFIVSPVFFNKLLPFILMAFCVIFAFNLGSIIAGKTCGLILTLSFVLFNMNRSGFSISQGFQRSFAFPLLLAGTYYLVSNKYWKAAFVIIAGYLIYPMISLVLLLTYGIIFLFRLLETKEKSLHLKQIGIPFTVIVIAVAVISFLILIESSRGPVIEHSDAGMYDKWIDETTLTGNPVYGPDGRFHVFREGSILGIPHFLIVGPGGLFTRSAWGYMGHNILPLILLSIFMLMLAGINAFRIKREIWFLLLSCAVLFTAAWIAALWAKKFIIFFPSRYTSTTIPFVMLIFISANLRGCSSKLKHKRGRVLLMLIGFAIILSMVLISPKFLGDTFSSDGILRESSVRVIQIIRFGSAALGMLIALYAILISFLMRGKNADSTKKLIGHSFPALLMLIILAFYVPGIGSVGVISPAREELELYRFFSTLPKNSYLAGHPRDMDNIPLYAKRMVFDNSEFSVEEIRLFDLFAAYYSNSPGEIIDFSRRYHVDYWLINKNRFTKKFLDKNRIYFEPFNQFILEIIGSDRNFVLNNIPDERKLFEIGDYYVIESDTVEK